MIKLILKICAVNFSRFCHGLKRLSFTARYEDIQKFVLNRLMKESFEMYKTDCRMKSGKDPACCYASRRAYKEQGLRCAGYTPLVK
jgi:hypothetical protein